DRTHLCSGFCLHECLRFVRWLLVRQDFSELRESEVHDLHVAVGAQHDVLGFDVAMNDADCVCTAECRTDLDGDLQRFRKLEWTTRKMIAKSRTLNVFHRDEVAARVCDSDLVD